MHPRIPHFETGDLLLYNTTKYWYSRAIEWFTSSNYSHVSMVLRRPTWLDPSLCEEEYYVLESGSECFPDAVSGDFKFGVQVHEIGPLHRANRHKRQAANGCS